MKRETIGELIAWSPILLGALLVFYFAPVDTDLHESIVGRFVLTAVSCVLGMLSMKLGLYLQYRFLYRN